MLNNFRITPGLQPLVKLNVCLSMYYALDTFSTSLLIAGLNDPENDISTPRYVCVLTVFILLSRNVKSLLFENLLLNIMTLVFSVSTDKCNVLQNTYNKKSDFCIPKKESPRRTISSAYIRHRNLRVFNIT